ncbi:MAG: hypothetical protein IH607_07055, partial [Firmicutes bacterium]|nr:hypothetical protein [Bacillota bacterium]
MKQLIAHPMHDIRVLWRQNAALRRLTLASAPVLLLGLWLGGLRTAMILTGYLQLAFRVALPGEPVENRLLQR